MRVPRFEPFPALRYAPAIALDDAAAPPYDVLSAADVAALRARHDRNVVEIDVPGPDDDIGRYDQAARTMRSWEAEAKSSSPTRVPRRMSARSSWPASGQGTAATE